MPPESLPRAGRVVLALLLAVPTTAAADPVVVRSIAVPLDRQDPAHASVGALDYRGGVQLLSADPRFGGISALRVLPGGERIVAITDEGSWLTARIVIQDGVLRGVAEVEMGALRGEDGLPLAGKSSRDAESLEVRPDGSFLVGFERDHRILHYPAGTGRPDGVPTRLPPPPGLESAPFNGGIETIVTLQDGRLLVLLEESGPGPTTRGWIGGPGDWRPVALRAYGSPRPADAARLPDGDVLVLERGYDASRGVTSVRLRRVRAGSVRPGAILDGPVVAELRPPLTVDNYEGASAWAVAGEDRLLIVSDDNFNAAAGQRTLLMMFRLRVDSR
jgi:hypothetical protein